MNTILIMAAALSVGSSVAPHIAQAQQRGLTRTDLQRHAPSIPDGLVSEARLYQLVRQQGPIVDRQFEIEFLDPGVEVFAFTLG